MERVAATPDLPDKYCQALLRKRPSLKVSLSWVENDRRALDHEIWERRRRFARGFILRTR